MERESFEDKEVAKILNHHFVAIKVDKEERPEIDAIYMKVCQMMTGSGGWPLTILMSPEQKPFYACTYLPKKSTETMMGLINLLNATIRIWNAEPEKLIRSGEEITDILVKEYQVECSMERPAQWMLEDAAEYYKCRFDMEFGGMMGVPKFPMPHMLLFLLRYGVLHDDMETVHMVEKTLESMYRGGIFDHIGGGFSRYSTDEQWLVPHFEKMLYDNALLVLIYLEAYQYSKKAMYLEVVERTLSYIMKEMTSPEGGFYSAQDADSEGVEGKYYTFTPDEVIQVLGQEAGEEFNTYYQIRKGGNFEGKSIPNLIGVNTLRIGEDKLKNWQELLYEYRSSRTELKKDDKILTSWNALMIVAFAKAYAILQNKEYLDHGKRAYEFIQNNLRGKDGRLLIRYREKEAIGLANIDDFSFLLWAQISLYEVTYDLEYLKHAKQTAHDMIHLFWDAEAGGFFFYGTDAKQLIARPKEVYDGAVPSGNSVAAYGLIQLMRILESEELRAITEKQTAFIAGTIKEHPAAGSFALCAVMQEIYPENKKS